MIIVSLKRIIQTKLIYSKSLGYRNRMFPATGFKQWIAFLKEIRLTPFSLFADVNAETHLWPHLFSSAVSLRTMPEWRRFEGQKERMQQKTRGRKEKGITLGFDSLRAMLRMLAFRGLVLVLQSYCFNASEVGAVKRARWHDAHAKQRKAEIWNSFFNDL